MNIEEAGRKYVEHAVKKIKLHGYIDGLDRCIEVLEEHNDLLRAYESIWNESADKKLEYNELLKKDM